MPSPAASRHTHTLKSLGTFWSRHPLPPIVPKGSTYTLPILPDLPNPQALMLSFRSSQTQLWTHLQASVLPSGLRKLNP